TLTRIASWVLVWMSLMVAGRAAADTLFKADLDGAQVVPPTESSALGHADLSLSDDQSQLTIYFVHNIPDDEMQRVHIHMGAPGTNGHVVFDAPVENPLSTVWTIPAEELDDLYAGLLYFVIHTNSFSGGEIRGQITLVEER